MTESFCCRTCRQYKPVTAIRKSEKQTSSNFFHTCGSCVEKFKKADSARKTRTAQNNKTTKIIRENLDLYLKKTGLTLV